MERICRNCRLYNEADGTCAVTVVIEGEHYELPVIASDSCHWERIDREIQGDLEVMKKIKPHFRARIDEEMKSSIEVKQTRMWSDGKNGYIETSE